MTIDTLKEYTDLSEKQLNQFSQYYNLLTFYNKQFNLTAIIAIGKILNPGISCKQIPFCSPSFSPLHTVRETFTSYGVLTSFYLVNSVRLHLLPSSLSFLICYLVNCNNF